MATSQLGQSRTYGRATLVAEAVAGAVLIASVELLPWVTYRVRGAAHPSQLHPGPSGIILLLIGCLTLALSAGQTLSNRRWLVFVSGTLGVLGLVLTVVSAASRMAHANAVTVSAGGTTSYESGAAFAALASIAIVVAAAVHLTRPR